MQGQRRIKNGVRLGVALLAVAGGATCVGSSETAMEKKVDAVESRDAHRAAGEYIVTVRPGGAGAQVRRVFGQYGIKSVKDLGKGRFLVKVDRDPGPQAMEAISARAGSIHRVQPNYKYRIPETRNPPFKLNK